jgi:Ca2+-binding EF-hand superfamily protein
VSRYLLAFVLAVSVAPPAFAQAQAQRRGPMRFQGMDRNGDGVITRDEWRGNARSFRIHDWNGDNVLSGDELDPDARQPYPDRTTNLRRPANDEPFTAWTDARFGEIDRNRDNRITRDEWDYSIASFRRADYNGDGSLSRDEFLGRRIDDDRTDRFDDLDYDRDRRIGRDEWHGSAVAFDHYDRNHDGFLTRQELEGEPVGTSGRVDERAVQAGYSRGLADGRAAGREDKHNGHGWDLEGQSELEHAQAGYTPQVGALGDYQKGYREGFRKGYAEGYGPRQ